MDDGTTRTTKKRALEQLGDGEPAYVAAQDGGSYAVEEMPKRIHCGYTVGERNAFIRAIHADDERTTALYLRVMSRVDAAVRELKANAATCPRR
ncbi:hypothetical protein ACP4OV_008740 [Aristida adscensionis]